jgi:hypothetical protein
LRHALAAERVQEEDRKILSRSPVAFAHLEGGWADFLHALAAEADQRGKAALVYDKPELAYGLLPVAPGDKDI